MKNLARLGTLALGMFTVSTISAAEMGPVQVHLKVAQDAINNLSGSEKTACQALHDAVETLRTRGQKKPAHKAAGKKPAHKGAKKAAKKAAKGAVATTPTAVVSDAVDASTQTGDASSDEADVSDQSETSTDGQ